MKGIWRAALIGALIAGSLGIAGIARADVENASATNVQDGQNRSSGSQTGSGRSGDAVGGQVSGVVSGGRASIDATNASRDSDVRSGDVNGSNTANSFVGLNAAGSTTTIAADIDDSCLGGGCANVQDGDNRYSLSQTLAAISGDGVGGQVIGLVATVRADPSIVAANTTDGVDVETGDAEGTNDSAAFVGLNTSADGPLITADIESVCVTSGCANVQEGDNRINSRQSADVHSGDGVGGQVIGAVTNWDTSVDASNHTRDSSVDTGDADAHNDAAYIAGLNTSGSPVISADIEDSCTDGCANVLDGDNRISSNQAARAGTGDGVAGSVIGVVSTRAVSVVAHNTSVDSDVETGDAEATNGLAAFVGLNTTPGFGPLVTADIENSCIFGCDNVQDGTNRLNANQAARASSGDGVAGQVIGVVAGGDASVDAANRSDGVSVETGDTEAHNDAATFVGLNTSDTITVAAADIEFATATNLQDGANRKTLSQSADATSGDGVAGQVSGVVTAAGGSASVVLANTSTDIDSSTGDSDFTNDESSFVGLNFSTDTVVE